MKDYEYIAKMSIQELLNLKQNITKRLKKERKYFGYVISKLLDIAEEGIIQKDILMASNALVSLCKYLDLK